MTATTARPAAPPTAPAPTVQVSAPVALTTAVLGAIAVALLWWHDTTGLHGLGDWLTNAGRITGLFAGYAVLLVLVLMARVPALDRGIGSDRLARWHAMLGRYVVSLAVAHTLLIIWGYAVSAHTGVVSQTSTLLMSYPDVLMATVALGLLVLVGVTSARAARRRMSYESWHFVHLYTYLAIALSFSHQFATGADFHDRGTRVLWAAMYVLVAAALLWYRVVVPIASAARHRMRVAAVVPEGRDVVSVYVTGRNLLRLGAQPGQFFKWRFLTRTGWWAANPYSLSAAPTSDTLRITVKTAGQHSADLRRLRPGTRVFAEGPYGGFIAARRRRRKVLLIGAGVGITPVRALFGSVPARHGDLTLLYRARTPNDLVLRRELEEIAALRGASLHYLIGDRRTQRLDAARLRRLVPDVAEHDVFLCGPDAMTAELRTELRRAGVPRSHIHAESFAL